MRRFSRAGVAAVALVALLAGGVALSGYGSRAISAVRAAAWDLDIERALDVAGIAEGMVVGEAGAGDGYFTLPMARRVGPSGAVYANDISRRALDRLQSNARREQFDNIHTVEGAVDDPRFPRRDLELIVIVHAFHDFSQPVEWLRNARKYLRPGAAVAIIDRDPSQGGDSHFWPRERILRYAEEAGFAPAKVVDVASRHVIVVVRPADTDKGLALFPDAGARIAGRRGYDRAGPP